LSDIFSNEQTVNDKSVEKIFNKIDNIFTEAESSLTTKEQENLASIEIKIDELLEKENSFFDKNLNELDNLFTQRDEVLTSTLNSKQKDQLKQLNESLNNIYKAFDNSPVHQESDKQVELLFNKIDSILNASFEQLSEKDKEKVNQYDNDIDTLLDKTLDFNNNEISYLLKKQNT
jgi:5'-3' exonuclease